MTDQRVENVYIPGRIGKVDPKTISEKDQDKTPTYWEKQAREARARREYLEEQDLSNRITNPAAPPEPPVKITGEVSLGKFDFQEQGRIAQELAERERKDAREREQGLLKERDELRSEIQKTQVERLASEFNGKFEMLAQQMQKGMSQRSFGEQYNDLLQIAGQLGLVKPDNGGGGSDPRFRLETLKMEADIAREERDFKWKMRQDEKQWQLDIKKLEVDAAIRREEIERQRQRDETFNRAPELIGRAIGKAMIETDGDVQVSSRPKTRGKVDIFPLEAEMGEAGTVDCPKCHSQIGIGPTINTAACAKCGSRVQITRTAPRAEREEEEEE